MYLDWSVSLACNLQLDPLPALVEHYLSLDCNNGSWLLRWLVFLPLWHREYLFVGNWQETAV